MSFAPIDWTALEDALHDWTAEALVLPGASVYFVEPELAGAVLPPVPAAQLQPLAGPLRLFAPGTHKVPGITRYRVRVTTDGPGDAGLQFYPAHSLTPIEIPLAAGPGDAPAVTAAALALAVAAAVPPGYSAAVDPEDAAAVLVDGSEAEPLFALSSASSFTATTLARARATEVDTAWSRMTWRVQLRSSTARGFGSASDMLGRLTAGISRGLKPRLHRAGWQFKGTLASAPSLPGTREEFRAALDFAIEGFATTVYQITPARAIGLIAA
jgi:hypothetical protein